jgi:hypothetical protein
MSDNHDTRLTALLESGWAVAGYSTCLSTLGIITHHVLLQQGSNLTTVMIAIKGADEEGRSLNALSPAPVLKKKGWFD